jgi:tRNA pseudouridine55 synthase
MVRQKTPVAGGIVLLDKPIGLSSNHALQRVRRIFGGVKAGHTGTLDPLASGMLPICLGEATKIAGEILSQGKCYTFSVQLGEQRSTGDAEGEVTAKADVPALSAAELEVAVGRFIGPQQQVPPMYSAIKRDGQPLYKLARAGLNVERAPRDIEITKLECLGGDEAMVLRFRVQCSKGTYVRVLGEDLARALGTVGFLKALCRDYVDPFSDTPMVTLEQLNEAAVSHSQDLLLLPTERALPHLTPVTLTNSQTRALYLGREITLHDSATNQPGCLPATALITNTVRLHDEHGVFFGLGSLDYRQLRAKRLYAAETAVSESGVNA